MARTKSILTEADWKQSFGELIKSVAEEQGVQPQDIGRRLDRLPGSTGRTRTSDWWRYANKGRIPTEAQIPALAEALRIPRNVLRVCAGYVDFIFESVYAAVSGRTPEGWDFPASPVKVALALLFSLFPGDEAPGIGNTGALWRWLSGNIVRLNLSSEDGFLTGEWWNSTWLYPVRSPEHVIVHHERRDNPDVTWVTIGDESLPEAWTWYSMRALLQVDIASAAASRVFELEGRAIPNESPLYEAQRVMHAKVLPLFTRIASATQIIHDWANALDHNPRRQKSRRGDLAAEVREHLHPWAERTITDEAARWALGERIEPDNSDVPPDAPRRVIMPHYSWDVEGRPDDFWR